MGDLNTVYATEECHRRMLVAAGVLDPTELLLPGRVFPGRHLFGDVYIDDLAIFLLCHFSRRGCGADDELSRRMQKADALYADLGIRSSGHDRDRKRTRLFAVMFSCAV